METSKDSGHRRPSASFVIGAIAFVFLVIGYQTAVFIHHAAVTKIIANHDSPDTVFIERGYLKDEADAPPGNEGSSYGSRSVERIYRRSSGHSEAAAQVRLENTPRKYESFPFNPNTVSIEDLTRLGFTLRQAQAIDNYRQKGGRFRRKSDFAKSYVVEDSVYKRLEPYIDIPRIDINSADSAAFETLPGIGKFFASRMVGYREELGGYSYKEQLMDIWHFDEEKYKGLEDLISLDLSKTVPFQLWSLPENELLKHPYIDRDAAHGIVLFRDNNPRSMWTVENLEKAGILTHEYARKLGRCLISEDDGKESPAAM